MASWLNQLSGKKKTKTRQLGEREFKVVDEGLDEEQVVAYINELTERKQSSPTPVIKIDQGSPSDSVRVIIERAVSDAEQIAASIKSQAKKEAEEEAARIIEQAKQSVAELKRKGETVSKQETESILEVLNQKTQLIEEEAKHRVESLLLQARQEIEKEVREEYKQAHSRLLQSMMKGAEEPVSPPGGNIVPQQMTAQAPVVKAPIAATTEAARPSAKTSWPDRIGLNYFSRNAAKADAGSKTEAPNTEMAEKLGWQEKIGLKKKMQPTPSESQTGTPSRINATRTDATIQPQREAVTRLPEMSKPKQQSVSEPKSVKAEGPQVIQNLDPEAIYSGEVELTIAVPVDPAAVSKLYNYLQSTSDMKILYTRGSWDRGTTITVALDKPLPFIGMISKIAGLTITPGVHQKEHSVKGTSNSLLGARKKEAASISLILKTEQSET